MSLSRLYVETLEAIEAGNCDNQSLRKALYPATKTAITQRIWDLKKNNLVVRIGYGKYRVTDAGKQELSESHYQKLEANRVEHYPGWTGLTPKEEPKQEVESVELAPTPSPEPPVAWDREFIKLAFTIVEQLGRVKENKE